MVRNRASDLLTAEDFFRGGDSAIRRVELKSLIKDGRPGVVHIRVLPAGSVLDLTDMPDTASAKEKREMFLGLIAESVVNADGTLVFTPENRNRVREIPVTVFNELSVVVAEMAGITPQANAAAKEGEEGKDSAVAHTSDSPTV